MRLERPNYQMINRIFNKEANQEQPLEPSQRSDEDPMTAIGERQKELSHFVHMVAKGMSDGLFIYGSGGIGKSETVRRTLGKEGITPVTINSHATALGIYKTLYQNRKNEIIFFDDADSIFADMKVLGLFRSALWGNPRLVTYTSTSSQLEDIPQSFVFESAIIMAANIIPKNNAAFKATLSRIDTFELKANNEEVLEFMRSIAIKQGFPGVMSSEVMSVIDFFESEAGSRQLSLRLLELSCKKVVYAREMRLDWRDLVRTQLHTLGEKSNGEEMDTAAHDLECMKMAFEEHPDSPRQQQAYWMKLTGKSRATFFRVKKQFQNQQA